MSAASAGAVGSSMSGSIAALCSRYARLDPRRAALRHRHPDPHLVVPDLRARPLLAVAGVLPAELPVLVGPEDAHRFDDHRAPLLLLDRGARARALARGTAIPDDGLIDHALPARRGRESPPRAAERPRRVLHGPQDRQST